MRILYAVLLVLAACGGPSRSTYARHPGAPLAFDRASANAEALGIADKTIAAHGGAAAWEKAKQIRWKQSLIRDGKVASSGEIAWDRWNARVWGKVDLEKGGVAVMYEIYGDYQSGYAISGSGAKQPLSTSDVAEGVKAAKDQSSKNLTITFAPFLLFEPGAKLEYAGLVKDEAGLEFHDLKLTFDPKDAARTGLIVHVYAEKDTHIVGRVELENAAGERYAYAMGGYTDVGGLKLATERKNVASSEIVKLEAFKVSDPDDMLFVAPMF